MNSHKHTGSETKLISIAQKKKTNETRQKPKEERTQERGKNAGFIYEASLQ